MHEAKTFVQWFRQNVSRLRESVIPLWHPLGFVSCVLDEARPEYVIRAHYWPVGERRVKQPHWPIHTHSYFLSSYVLAGTIRDRQYRSTDAPQYTVYSVDYYQGGSRVINTGRQIGLQVERDLLWACGETYEVKTNVFHRTDVAISESAVTLVALSDFTADAPLVLGEDLESSYSYNRVEFDGVAFWRAVEESLHRHR
jgi:hypothetical protein